MDSPLLQSAFSSHRMRSSSNLSAQSVDSYGAIRKRTPSWSNYTSTSQVDRLYELALEQANRYDGTGTFLSSAPDWLTPHSSPQPDAFSDSNVELVPEWSVPTPPYSDSGLPAVSIDSNEVPVTANIGSSSAYDFPYSTASAEMSSLGFLLPSQYGSGPIEAEPISYNMEQNYAQPPRVSQPVATNANTAYVNTVSSSPALYQSRTHSSSDSGASRPPEMYYSNDPYRRVPSSYDSTSSAEYSITSAPTIPSISGLTNSPHHSPHLSSNMPGLMQQHYQQGASRSPSLYDSGMYAQQQYAQQSSQGTYAHPQSLSYPGTAFVGSSPNEIPAKPSSSDATMRVLNSRPKPQCWDHGCNGRQFSTFSNLLRHQREKSGTASKSYCPKCGAEFTRTTARNGHMAHDKCQTKTRNDSDEQ